MKIELEKKMTCITDAIMMKRRCIDVINTRRGIKALCNRDVMNNLPKVVVTG